MHAVTPGNETKYKIVECQDPSCNICTMTGGGRPPSTQAGGIAVYTCSNPSCSLCAGDCSLLLDIVNPALAPSEDCFLQQYSTRPNHRNATTTGHDDSSQLRETGPRGNKRKLPNCYGYPAKSRRHSLSNENDVMQRPSSDDEDDVNSIDELQLMSLALELELDKVEWLPDLQDNFITELYHEL